MQTIRLKLNSSNQKCFYIHCKYILQNIRKYAKLYNLQECIKTPFSIFYYFVLLYQQQSGYHIYNDNVHYLWIS